MNDTFHAAKQAFVKSIDTTEIAPPATVAEFDRAAIALVDACEDCLSTDPREERCYAKAEAANARFLAAREAMLPYWLAAERREITEAHAVSEAAIDQLRSKSKTPLGRDLIMEAATRACERSYPQDLGGWADATVESWTHYITKCLDAAKVDVAKNLTVSPQIFTTDRPGQKKIEDDDVTVRPRQPHFSPLPDPSPDSTLDPAIRKRIISLCYTLALFAGLPPRTKKRIERVAETGDRRALSQLMEDLIATAKDPRIASTARRRIAGELPIDLSDLGLAA